MQLSYKPLKNTVRVPDRRIEQSQTIFLPPEEITGEFLGEMQAIAQRSGNSVQVAGRGPHMNTTTADSWQVIVIGAGAAGLLAAARVAERGRRTLLLEKNRKPGVKILMSGGTRCNLTHATDAAGIVAAFGRQGRFLHSALAALGPRQLVELFHAEGVATKVEPGGKVFPVSDRALDIQRALLQRLARSGCELRLGQPVQAIERSGRRFSNHDARR